MLFALYAGLGYLVGSIPFGFIIGRLYGLDIRTQGSGNIGSTNVSRVLGRKWGILCFLLDVAKGLAPVFAAGSFARQQWPGHTDAALSPIAQWFVLLTGAACIVGHMFSLYLRFRGGKGVATSLGVVLGVWPYFTFAGVVAFALWVAVWGMWRYVSLASIVAAVAFPAALLTLIWRMDAWALTRLWPLVGFSVLMAALVILRHRSNIARLLAGTELRGGQKKTS